METAGTVVPLPVLERLKVHDSHMEAQQHELTILHERLTWLENHLTELLGVNCAWTPPPPQPIEIPRLNRVR